MEPGVSHSFLPHLKAFCIVVGVTILLYRRVSDLNSRSTRFTQPMSKAPGISRTRKRGGEDQDVPHAANYSEHYALGQTSMPESFNGFGKEYSPLPDGRLDTLVVRPEEIYGKCRVNLATVPARRDLSGWPRYHQTLTAKAMREGAGVRVLLLGDSITEVLGGTERGPPMKSLKPHTVWKDYYEGLGSLNLGVSGDQTQHLLWRIQNGELPEVLQPQSILLAIGTNNLGRGMSVDDTVGGIQAVIEYLREQRPDALLCVMALFPRGPPDHGPRLWDAVAEVNGKVERFLQERAGDDKISFVNCTDSSRDRATYSGDDEKIWFLEEDESGTKQLNKRLIMPDNVHLTVEGLKTWSACAAEAIRLGFRRV